MTDDTTAEAPEEHYAHRIAADASAREAWDVLMAAFDTAMDDPTDVLTGEAVERNQAVVVHSGGQAYVLDGDLFDSLDSADGRERYERDNDALPESIEAALSDLNKIVLDGRNLG